MDKDQLHQVIEEVQKEFYADSHFGESYFGQFMAKSDQDRFDNYFLFSAVVRDCLSDSFAVVDTWQKKVDKKALLDDTEMGDIERVARELGEQVAGVVARYLGLGFRRGHGNKKVENKKEADLYYHELQMQPASLEETLLRVDYELRELQERIVGAAMMQAAHWLAHHNKGLSWETICGGFCYGIVTACMQAWTFGGRVAEMVLISDELTGLDFDEGEPDGETTEEAGPDVQ